MTTLEIKSDIHKMVEEIEQEQYLLDIHQSLSALLDVRDVMDVLSEEQRKNLQKSFQQAQNGKVESFQDLKQRHSQWFTR